jgi:hypothetical protein
MLTIERVGHEEVLDRKYPELPRFDGRDEIVLVEVLIRP